MRFPEFSDPWQTTILGEVAEIKKGSGISKDQLSLQGNPCILYGELYTTYSSEVIREIRSHTEINPSTLILSQAGDVIIPSSGETAIDIAVARCVLVNNVALGGDLNVIRSLTTDGRFLAYLLNGPKKREIAEFAQGIAVVHLYGRDLSKLNISLPSIAEQRKIAEFLSLIDERIETQRHTIEEYKNLRSATVKEVSSRIVEWDSLESLVDNGAILLRRGEIIPKSEYSSTNQYPVYSSSVKNKGLMGYTDKFMFEDERITWSIDGGGDLFYRHPHKYSVTNVCGILEIVGEYDYRFLCAILQRQHLRLRFDYQTKAHPSVIVKLYKVPRIHLEQQVHYGVLFASIDERIEVEEKLLGRYEEQKQYLLQKMFV